VLRSTAWERDVELRAVAAEIVGSVGAQPPVEELRSA
jgi:hypothetical protein